LLRVLPGPGAVVAATTERITVHPAAPMPA
jgi:hypothetical protein